MKIIALLAYWDERHDWLAECVSSLGACCDHVVALDGPYALFPLDRERSRGSCSQWAAARQAANRWGLGFTWGTANVWESEVAKRNALFTMGNELAEPGDWFVIVDADMLVTSVPSNLHRILDLTDRVVGTYWLKDGEYGGRHPIRLLFKASPELRVTTTHYGYRLGDQYLWETGGMPAVETDLIIEHRGHLRSKERNDRADEYDRRVQELGIETAQA